MSVPSGYTPLPNGMYTKTDGSGPYVFDGTTMTLAAAGTPSSSSSGALTTSAVGRRTRVSITRPANQTPYSANDVVGATAAAITIAGIGPASGHVMITSVDLTHEVTAIPSGMTSFRLYLYNATPPSALADNAAFDLPSGDLTSFIGYVDLGVIADLGSNLFVQVDNVLKHVQCDASGNLYGYLVTNGAWTPGANSTVFDLVVRTMGI